MILNYLTETRKRLTETYAVEVALLDRLINSAAWDKVHSGIPTTTQATAEPVPTSEQRGQALAASGNRQAKGCPAKTAKTSFAFARIIPEELANLIQDSKELDNFQQAVLFDSLCRWYDQVANSRQSKRHKRRLIECLVKEVPALAPTFEAGQKTFSRKYNRWKTQGKCPEVLLKRTADANRKRRLTKANLESKAEELNAAELGKPVEG